MSPDNHEVRKERLKYILFVIILCALLGFGIFTIRKKSDTSNQPALISAEETTEATLQPEETAAAETSAAEATEDTSEEATEDTTEAILPTEPSAPGPIAAEVQHLYVRINHTQRIQLDLPPGVSQNDIRWSTDDPDIVDLAAGQVTGLQKGTCIVTASYGEEHVDIPVTVRELTIVNGITYVDGLLVVNKSYSLPAEYDPGLLPITEEAFNVLAEDAAKEGLDLYIGSSYRSYDFQEKVYNSMVSGYSKQYADELSARPGHSEHQSGYSIDCNSIDNNFAETPAGQWLAAHAHEYGFIIRFPEGKEKITGYAYESWHIRYVGIEHATNMYEQGLTLEEYLDVKSVYDDAEEETEDDAEEAEENDTPDEEE
ncbi:MAG: D-alanyl-D-alanine carboxypeptidase family protein [Oscillospiraceae bacterium]|nr:D-alanyl-D-alanine carboxypeptidase family protein [Oscillospiraceae bacterium]